MAAGAGEREEGLAALLRGRIVQPVRLDERALCPRRVFLGRMHDERDEHVGMAGTAELEALALVRPRLIGLDPEIGLPPRYGVLLPADVRHPERVDDVLRREVDVHLHVHRDMQLGGTLQVRPVLQFETVFLWIVEDPRPLLALHVDGHARAARVVHHVELLEREHREADDHDGWHDRPQELEEVVSVELLRDVAGSIAELDAGVDQAAIDDREHDDGADEHDPVHVCGCARLRPKRVIRPRSHAAPRLRCDFDTRQSPQYTASLCPAITHRAGRRPSTRSISQVRASLLRSWASV